MIASMAADRSAVFLSEGEFMNAQHALVSCDRDKYICIPPSLQQSAGRTPVALENRRIEAGSVPGNADRGPEKSAMDKQLSR